MVGCSNTVDKGARSWPTGTTHSAFSPSSGRGYRVSFKTRPSELRPINCRAAPMSTTTPGQIRPASTVARHHALLHGSVTSIFYNVIYYIIGLHQAEWCPSACIVSPTRCRAGFGLPWTISVVAPCETSRVHYEIATPDRVMMGWHLGDRECGLFLTACLTQRIAITSTNQGSSVQIWGSIANQCS